MKVRPKLSAIAARMRRRSAAGISGKISRRLSSTRPRRSGTTRDGGAQEERAEGEAGAVGQGAGEAEQRRLRQPGEVAAGALPPRPSSDPRDEREEAAAEQRHGGGAADARCR